MLYIIALSDYSKTPYIIELLKTQLPSLIAWI